MRIRPFLPSLSLAGAALVACQAGPTPNPHSARPAAATRSYVDSILPIEEELRRFRADLSDTATSLQGGAHTREALVRRFANAVERSDTVAIREMVVTASEFAWLYYPTTIHVAPPYELGPGLIWFQIQNNSSKGISRAWRRYAGRPLAVVGHRCESQPRLEGDNRLWNECVLLRAAGPDTVAERLFGSIIERRGRFKFVGYANKL